MVGPDPVETLANHLAAQPFGSLQAGLLIPLLVAAWGDLGGPTQESTWSDRLSRIEGPRWAPPVLRFELERHGGTANGSSRAEVHFWEVDLSKREARITNISRRQARPMDGRLDVRVIVDELVELVKSDADDPRLVWNKDRSEVRIVIGKKTIPMTNKTTTAARRKRFAAALRDRAAYAGWRETRLYTFRTRWGEVAHPGRMNAVGLGHNLGQSP